MKGFLDKLTGGDGDDNKKKDGGNNPFANFGKPKRSFGGGGGQTLGGSKPGKVLNISLDSPGPLGLKIEKRPNSKTAIISMVIPDGQAEKAGLQRGDILCFAGSDGQDEIMFDDFLTMARSDQRPLVFDIRRIVTISSRANNNANSNIGTARSNSHSSNYNNKKQSADAHAKRQAVIAAAEARERKHKQQTKGIKPKTKSTIDGTPALLSTAERLRLEDEREARAREAITAEPMSEEAKRAIAIAKKDERDHAAELGYNPYETAKVNAGQARTATVAMTHGTMTNNNDNNSNAGQSLGPAVVQPPTAATTSVGGDEALSSPASSKNNKPKIPVSVEFEDALTSMLSTNDNHDDVKSSLKIIVKLVTNATTKGQQQATGKDDDAAAKFRRVRLSNPKIKAAITDMNGALDIMFAVGFQFIEEDGETYLVYPLLNATTTTMMEWIPSAIEMMDNAQEQQHNPSMSL